MYPLVLETLFHYIGLYLFSFCLLHLFCDCRASLIFFKDLFSKELPVYLAMIKAFFDISLSVHAQFIQHQRNTY